MPRKRVNPDDVSPNHYLRDSGWTRVDKRGEELWSKPFVDNGRPKTTRVATIIQGRIDNKRWKRVNENPSLYC